MKLENNQTLCYIINIFQMLSIADNKYQQMIQDRTQRIILFPHRDNYGNKFNVKLQCNIKLPSSHHFRSSQQIENNTQIIHHITHQSSKQYPTVLHNQWPHSCIGLVLCEHHQNNQKLYIYGTGTLIYKNIVATSAQNVYCRRLNTQYTNIRFITGVCGDKCSGIYDIKIIHYPKEYIMQLEYENYNFAVLQLYDDLSNSCGYVGWKTIGDRKFVGKYIEYGYISDNQEGSFKLRQIKKNKKSQQDQYLSGSRVLFKENQNKHYLVGLRKAEREGFIILSDKIRNMVNYWTNFTIINLNYNKIDTQGYKYLSQANWIHLKYINLSYNNIDDQECKYLSQANWTHLANINLYDDKIDAQGCKYLSQANWIHLTQINLNYNGIGAQGCRYLTNANWKHLKYFYLGRNNVDTQGCKYLSQANWIHLSRINLNKNNIDAQGCKYLSQANWTHLTQINFGYNHIGAQGCKYLSQANWTHLTQINLKSNNIDAQGCKYLSQANWTHLTQINFGYNHIGAQGCKYLSQANWTHLTQIDLYGNDIEGVITYRLLLLSSYPNTYIRI